MNTRTTAGTAYLATVLVFVNKKFRSATTTEQVLPGRHAFCKKPRNQDEATRLVYEVCRYTGSISLVGWFWKFLRFKLHEEWCEGAAEGMVVGWLGGLIIDVLISKLILY